MSFLPATSVIFLLHAASIGGLFGGFGGSGTGLKSVPSGSSSSEPSSTGTHSTQAPNDLPSDAQVWRPRYGRVSPSGRSQFVQISVWSLTQITSLALFS